MSTRLPSKINAEVRPIRADDIPGIISLCERVYPGSTAWNPAQLESHMRIFPRGQLVAEDAATGNVLAYAAGLIVNWDDYNASDPWRDFTDRGMFTNHDPDNGRTLYGAEVMVDPALQGQGLGAKLYEARRELCRELRLLRIRAGARLRGYHAYADTMSPQDYTLAVIQAKVFDPTLSFQLRQGFQVLDVVHGYLREDPESRGNAALIEWINAAVAEPRHIDRQRESRFFVENFEIKKI
ncbi:MAG: GNAT family N-acetyltransferase [Bdellovibrionota bacterium]